MKQKSEQYFYNSISRMAQSVVIDTIEKTHTSTQYGYDAFGRRNLVQDQGSSTMRTLYDGFSFDIVQEAEVFQGGDFTTSYMELGSIQYTQTQTGTSRYRYVGDDPKTVQYGDLTQESTRYTGSRATLYANGQAVATNRSASLYDNGRAYFGTDILGSVRSATDDYASLEDRYEYDIFGTPYEGDFNSGLNTGYTGKPYDTVTGLYNYGYRDYSPQVARFTTVDPIRDGNNWFSYVVNDPVNYVDLWGLEASCGSDANNTFESDLRSLKNGTDAVPLSNLINTKNLATILVDNSHEFTDTTTKDFIDSSGKDGIENVLDDVTVYFGTDEVNANKVLGQYGQIFLDGVTVGNSIFMKSNKPNNITQSMANLLGHEAIHSIQAEAYGGAENFLEEYVKFPYTADNPFELDAYTFGGGLDVHPSFRNTIKQQVFNRNQLWWMK